MDDVIVQKITKALLPFIQMYGFFIIFNGHLSPGGSFAGGTVLGASMILYTLSFGLEQAEKKLSHQTTHYMESFGVLWFIAFGLLGIVLGGRFLSNQDVGIFMGTPGRLISGGLIPLITFGIGMKVAGTFVTIFHAMIKED